MCVKLNNLAPYPRAQIKFKCGELQLTLKDRVNAIRTKYLTPSLNICNFFLSEKIVFTNPFSVPSASIVN